MTFITYKYIIMLKMDTSIIISLPKPKLIGKMSIEEAIARRQSIRQFTQASLTMEQLSQLLWSAQGITEQFRRAVPSAGATYPLDIFAVIGIVEGANPGVYHYLPIKHSIELIKKGDLRRDLSLAALNQEFIANAPLNIVITGEYSRTTLRYGSRGEKYVHMEVGHAGQNLSLIAQTLGLGTVVIGAFIDEEVIRCLNLPKKFTPLYIMPFGYPQVTG
ncbi:MAG: SagB/ThcOx family dehydrogenase [bacterium]